VKFEVLEWGSVRKPDVVKETIDRQLVVDAFRPLAANPMAAAPDFVLRLIRGPRHPSRKDAHVRPVRDSGTFGTKTARQGRRLKPEQAGFKDVFLGAFALKASDENASGLGPILFT